MHLNAFLDVPEWYTCGATSSACGVERPHLLRFNPLSSLILLWCCARKSLTWGIVCLRSRGKLLSMNFQSRVCMEVIYQFSHESGQSSLVSCFLSCLVVTPHERRELCWLLWHDVSYHIVIGMVLKPSGGIVVFSLPLFSSCCMDDEFGGRPMFGVCRCGHGDP